MKRKAVTLQLEGEIPQPKSAYDLAVEDGYEGNEEQYGKELAAIPPTQEQFDAIPGRISKLTTTTDKSDFHHITDSAADGVLEFGMEGKTEQETTPGNQLFDVNLIKYYTSSGITASIDGTILTLNGTNTSTAYIEFDLPKVIPMGTQVSFTLDNVTANSNVAIRLQSSGVSDGNTYFALDKTNKKITVTTSKNCDSLMILVNPTTINMLFSIMLSKNGNAELEPYTNGPSPNPDYPQEIENAGKYNEATGRYEIGCKVVNKNLFVIPLLTSGFYLDQYNGNAVASENYYMSDYISVLNPLYKYVLFYGELTKKRLILYDKNKQYIKGNGGNDIVFYISMDSDVEYFRYSFYCEDIDSIVGKEIIIERSNTISPSEYVEGKSQPFTLTSPVPLTKWDYLTKRDGVWGWSVYKLPFIIGGTGNWIYHAGLGCFYLECLPEVMVNHEGFCNQLRVAMPSEKNSLYIGNNNKVILVYNTKFHDETLSDGGLANWKAHLVENPLEIWTYADEEQSFHQLPDEEQTLLNNLETYYGVTNLYNDQGCPMWLTYVQDTKTAVDNKFNNIKQALLSLGANV